MKNLPYLQTRIIDNFVKSKTGNPEDCEDLVHVSDNIIAVIDGATSKSRMQWNGETGGRLAARIVSEVLKDIPHDYTVQQATELMTSRIHEIYAKFNVMDEVLKGSRERITASFSAINLRRNEIWLVGDCQFSIDGEVFSPRKVVDNILANARALFLELELINGATIEELIENEVGREYIKPLLEKSVVFENNISYPDYWYPVVNGFHIPDEGFIVEKIKKDTETIILATDGYPVLKDTLKESEENLYSILSADPLLFREFKSTKGLTEGSISFDDRAYVRVEFNK